jgi:hypothetical protein
MSIISRQGGHKNPASPIYSLGSKRNTEPHLELLHLANRLCNVEIFSIIPSLIILALNLVWDKLKVYAKINTHVVKIFVHFSILQFQIFK